MKGILRGAAAVAFGMLLSAPAVRAQGAEFALGGGVGVPLGDFDDSGAKIGWHGLAAVSIVPGGWPVGILFDGSYQQFSLEDGSFGTLTGLKTRFIMGTGNIVFKFKTSEESTFRPYLIGGVGAYNSKTTADDDPGDILGGGETDFGLNAGAGFDFKAGGAGLFIEGRFHNVFTSGAGSDLQFIPITVGIRFGGN